MTNRSVLPSNIAAVSFDFFNTLAVHRGGRGRGALVMEYFRAHDWASAPWDHAALYDVFAAHGNEFTPTATSAGHRAFAGRVATTLFRRLDVQADPALAETHGVELWRILGPEHLALFPDVQASLRGLRAVGLRLAVTSNWQHGLRAFCEALGIGVYFEVVGASAEVGVAKPDARIFIEVCRQLALPPNRVLHVGDSRAEDVDAARAAGLHALWLCRDPGDFDGPDLVRSLDQVAERLVAA